MTPEQINRAGRLWGRIAFWALVGTLFFVTGCQISRAQDYDPELSKWYRTLMQPDQPSISCCGEADAYHADSFEQRGDQYIAIITDERPDEPFRRKHIPPGTKFIVPNFKLKYDQGNPTGHGVIFVRANDAAVLCYIPPGGV